MASVYGFVTAYWDNGFTDQYGFGLFERETFSVTSSGQVIINAIK